MGNKKGFTLVELLAVIVLLLILVLTAFPSFGGLSNTAKNKYDNTANVLIKSAAKMYVNNHMEEVDNEIRTKGSCEISIQKLITSEYLDTDIMDSRGQTIDSGDNVIVTKEEKDGAVEYIYSFPKLGDAE